MQRIPHLLLALLTLAFLTTACSEGGSEERTNGEVQISATHHLFGFRALSALSQYPLTAADTFPDQGLLNLFDDELYTVTRSSGTSGAQNYALQADGELAILVTGDPREPTAVWRGGYGLEGETNLFFFTDRGVISSSPSVGMFFGTRTIPGTADLSGGWHMFSLHFIFENTQLVDPRFVARSAYGTLDVASGTPGDSLAFTGTGLESTSATLTFDGTMQALADGAANLSVTYTQTGAAGDTRVFQAGAGTQTLLAVDSDESDGEAGLLIAMRARSGAIDAASVAGDYHIGALTAFVDPLNPGCDGAYGNLNLTEGGAFRIDMVGAGAVDFIYQGTWAEVTGAGNEGLIELTVNGTGEVWRAAVDEAYDTVVIVDNVLELRSNGGSEINLFLALRKNDGI